MKHLFIIALLFSNVYLLSAQEKVNAVKTADKFIDENTHWTEVYLNWGTLQWIEDLYELNGTTTANNNTYWKVYKNGNEIAWLREDNQHKLYICNWKEPKFYPISAESEVLIYSFSKPWEIGDNIMYGKENLDDSTPYILIEHEVKQIDYIQLKDGKEYPIVDKIIYSIGSIDGLLSSYLIRPADMSETGLLNYYRNGVLLYENQTLLEKKKDMERLSAISSFPANKNLQVINRNEEVIFELQTESADSVEFTLSIYNTNGEQLSIYTLKSGSVSVCNLPKGCYFYRLNRGKDLLETGKFQN